MSTDPARSRRQPRQHGFSLIEALAVLAILGILANLAYPYIIEAHDRARAAAIVGDFRLIRQAVHEHYRDHGAFPPDYTRGNAPSELSPYLEAKVSWQFDNVKYDWENWVRRNGKPKHKRTGVLYGLSVVTADKELIQAIEKVYPGPTTRIWNNRVTFIIEPISS